MKSPFKLATARPVREDGSRELFPHMAKHVDKMAFIHSLLDRLEQPLAGAVQDEHRHDAAWASRASARGSPTAWAARARACRRSCVMYDTLGRGMPKGHAQNWGAGFLPTRVPGHRAQAAGRADRQPRRGRRTSPPTGSARSSTCCAKLNKQATGAARPARPSWPPASRRFELAYRMQMAAPEALDLDEGDRARRRSCTASTTRSATHFAKQCLIARRLVERGVRFVQIYSRRHGERPELGRPHQHRQEPRRVRGRDRPADRRRCSTDLERRGLLEDTLVIWGGEFGRLPIVQKGERRPRPQPARVHRTGWPAAA